MYGKIFHFQSKNSYICHSVSRARCDCHKPYCRGLLSSQLQNRGPNIATLLAYLKVISKSPIFSVFLCAKIPPVSLPSQQSPAFICPASTAGRTKGSVINASLAEACSQPSHLHFFHKSLSNLYSKRQLLSWLLALETTVSNKMQ